MNKIKAFICDIDGTVADHEGIRGHLDYDKVMLDKPNPHVIHVVTSLILSPSEPDNVTCVFVSGRPERSRDDTKEWLGKNVFTPYDNELFMRPDWLANGLPDYRKDYIVKEEIYRNHIEPKYDIQFAIDDRPQVLRMWQSLGIPTFAVGTPWIDF